MSNQFSDQCKTCALAGTCKTKGCIKTATALIDEYKAEIAELKDEVENLNGELMFRPKYGTLTERIAELEADKLDADTNAQEWEVENKELKDEIDNLRDHLRCRGE